jgi:FKBP-type peptidyl-prolyl cis-trans isomerase
MVKSLLALSDENPTFHRVFRPHCAPRLTFLSSRGRDPVCPRRRALLVAASTVASLLPASPAFALAKDLKEEYRQGTAALADDDSTAPVPREAYQKLDSGVVFADLRTGNGEAAKVGSRVNLQWVLRKSNGYFVDSSEVNDSVPFIFTVGDGTAIAGLNEAVQGMKVGGVRRILIPPSLAYVDGLDDGKPGPLPTGFGPRQQMRRVQTVRKDVPGEYVYLEVQMTRLRWWYDATKVSASL